MNKSLIKWYLLNVSQYRLTIIMFNLINVFVFKRLIVVQNTQPLISTLGVVDCSAIRKYLQNSMMNFGRHHPPVI